MAIVFLGGAVHAEVGKSAGESIYQSACIACHGADGAGALPGVPDMAGTDSPLVLGDDLLLKRTIEGFQSPGSPMAMPPRAGNPELSDADLKAALRYMREKFGRR
ncbi:MAG: c-type cytochrome [Rhodocyclaceae bacterium]|nr:c-type cytochrome [Rhodocyclaceae bacterium]